MKKSYLPGLILILLGSFLLLNQFFDMSGSILLVFVGIGLLTVRFITGRFGFTIAGSVVLCLGLGGIVSDLHFLSGDLRSAIQLLLLAMGFFLMHIIDYRRIGNWPLIPGLCLVGIALIIFLDDIWSFPIFIARNIGGIIRQFWPIALICAGAVTLGGVFRKRNRQDEGGQGNPNPNWSQTQGWNQTENDNHNEEPK